MTFPQVYTVILGNKKYQVEVEILEKKRDYIHIALAIDDGSFFRWISPISTSFIVYENGKIEKE